MIYVLCILLSAAVGFAAAWLLKPTGERIRGRCGYPLKQRGRYCQRKVAPGRKRCWRHEEPAPATQLSLPEAETAP